MAGSSGSHVAAALLFQQSIMNTLDAMSTLNSSPWTAESFGADEDRRASLFYYVRHSVIASMAVAMMASFIVLADDGEDNSVAWYPVVGAAMANIYLVWLYRQASNRGKMAGNTNWHAA
jgi:hypothetical protein